MKNILIVVIFVVVIGVIAALYVRRRSIAFEGIVTDKDIQEFAPVNNSTNQQTGITFGNSGGVEHKYMIKVKTDNGKSISWQVSQGKYQIINIGDRITKHSGTTEVEVTPKAQPATPSQPMPPTTAITN